MTDHKIKGVCHAQMEAYNRALVGFRNENSTCLHEALASLLRLAAGLHLQCICRLHLAIGPCHGDWYQLRCRGLEGEGYSRMGYHTRNLHQALLFVGPQIASSETYLVQQMESHFSRAGSRNVLI